MYKINANTRKISRIQLYSSAKYVQHGFGYAYVYAFKDKMSFKTDSYGA
jgi:hypothetical protein